MSQAVATDAANLDAQIDAALDRTVLKMTPALLQSLIHELGRGLHPYAEIAVRYGFSGVDALYQTLTANEAFRMAVKAEHAVWHSEDNLERRLRVQHQLILHEAAHENAKPLFDPSTTVNQRVDLIKAIATVGGVHGMPGQGGSRVDGGPDGPRWTIQMVFPNAGKVEEITLRAAPTAQTIEGEGDVS
jgi:hypothetical protein